MKFAVAPSRYNPPVIARLDFLFLFCSFFINGKNGRVRLRSFFKPVGCVLLGVSQALCSHKETTIAVQFVEDDFYLSVLSDIWPLGAVTKSTRGRV